MLVLVLTRCVLVASLNFLMVYLWKRYADVAVMADPPTQSQGPSQGLRPSPSQSQGLVNASFATGSASAGGAGTGPDLALNLVLVLECLSPSANTIIVVNNVLGKSGRLAAEELSKVFVFQYLVLTVTLGGYLALAIPLFGLAG